MVNRQADRSRERAREDYLKAIYQLTTRKPVKAAEVARYLRVSRASVSKIRRVLERDGLIEAPTSRVEALTLTRRGLSMALRMVRRHRLVETFLHRSLGVPLGRVHRDAEKIEHAISDDIARRLASILGNPASDPHGHPIPAPGARKARAHDVSLAAVKPGTSIEVTALDDQDESVVRRLDSLGVLPRFRGVVISNGAEGTRLRAGRREISVPRSAAARVRCVQSVRNRRLVTA